MRGNNLRFHPMKYSLFFLLLCGCSSSTFATTYYLDPINGSLSNDGSATNPWPSLKEVIDNNLIETYEYTPLPYDPAGSQLVIKNAGAPIHAGDTLLLRDGLHGEVEIDRMYNVAIITIMAAPGHTPLLAKLHLRSCRNWRLQGLDISSEPYNYYVNDKLLYIESHSWRGPASHIEIIGCHLYSGTNSWDWTAQDWLAKVSSGIHIKGNHVLVQDNILTNVDMGITLVGDSCQAINNQVINFSGDGMRPLGAYLLLEGNTIKNCFDVDDNHDDGIQSFNLGTYDVHHVTIRGNTIINYEDPNQPLLGPLQGMGFFDGPYNNWIVENNVVSVNHWHGITFLGAYDCQVLNNTVIDPTPDITPGASWIRIDDHKDGTPSAGCVVKNNVANQFIVDGEMSNNVVINTYPQYDAHFQAFAEYNFRLLPTSTLIDQADEAYAPNTDILGISRPQGPASDIGAYEYVSPSGNDAISHEGSIVLYPNPVTDVLVIDFTEFQTPEEVVLEIYNVQGQCLLQQKVIKNTAQLSLNISRFPTGIYVIYFNRKVLGKLVKQ